MRERRVGQAVHGESKCCRSTWSSVGERLYCTRSRTVHKHDHMALEKRVTQNARRGETRGLTTRRTIQRHPTHERIAKHEDNSRILFVISTTSTHALSSYIRRAQSLATAERLKHLHRITKACTESLCVNEACRRVYRTIANGLTSACCSRSKEAQSSQI